MFRYYLRLGLKSLRRSPALTALIVLILGVGIAASMTSLTMFLVLAGDPIPSKSDRLLVPQFDTGPMDESYRPGEQPDRQMTWIDVDNHLRQAKGVRQTALYGVVPTVDARRADLPPFFEAGMATTRDAFAMFNVPFADGGAWSAEDDARGADVAVIARPLAEKLFGDARAVGHRVRLDEREYTVVGVMGDWNPRPRYHRINGSGINDDIEPLWVPLRNAVGREWRNNGWTSCSGDVEPGFAGFLRSECTWLQYWVELESAAQAPAYRDYLAAYVAEQKLLGRMPRPDNSRLHNVREWLALSGALDNDTRLSVGLAFSFLLVCLINVAVLMLAKTSARSGDIGVRRALGATRADVFQQSLIEAGVLGLAGAGLGLALTAYGLSLVNGRLTASDQFYSVDPWLLGSTLLLGVAAALAAALLPTWQACRVRPAIQLKSQ